MVYQLNQNTQLGSVTDEMLQKLMDKKAKNEGEEQIDQQRDRQLDKEEIERVRLQGVKDHEDKKTAYT